MVMLFHRLDISLVSPYHFLQTPASLSGGPNPSSAFAPTSGNESSAYQESMFRRISFGRERMGWMTLRRRGRERLRAFFLSRILNATANVACSKSCSLVKCASRRCRRAMAS